MVMALMMEVTESRDLGLESCLCLFRHQGLGFSVASKVSTNDREFNGTGKPPGLQLTQSFWNLVMRNKRFNGLFRRLRRSQRKEPVVQISSQLPHLVLHHLRYRSLPSRFNQVQGLGVEPHFTIPRLTGAQLRHMELDDRPSRIGFTIYMSNSGLKEGERSGKSYKVKTTNIAALKPNCSGSQLISLDHGPTNNR